MPPLLSSCTKAAAFISAAYCLMFGSVAARVTRRTAVRRKQCQHIPAVFSPAFLLPISASGTAHVLRTLPRRPKRIQQHKLIRRHRAVATASLVPSIQQLRERDRVCNVHNSLLGVGISIGRSSSSSSSTRRRRSLLPAHTDTAAQHASVSPSSLPSKPTAPSNVVVLALGSNTDDLERCQRLAQHLGVSLVVRGREDGPDKQEEGQKGEQEEKHQQQERSRKRRQSKGGGADGESRDFKFTMMFDESGRLALGQPGSGFNPLVVDFSGGKTGHRSKHQQGKEQVVKAAALPKRRTASVSADKSLQAPSLLNDGSKDGDDDPAAPLPVLWDLTAGLGTDAFLLAQAGWRVEMFERSPVVAALVQDALDRARVGDDETARSAASRMSLTVADSTDALAAGIAAQDGRGGGSAGDDDDAGPDVVYLDPMFPQQTEGKKKTKSALAKKGMQMLQALLEGEGTEDESGGIGLEDAGGHHEGSERGADDAGRPSTGGGAEGPGGHAEEERKLFDVAMSLATRKVVVKRPVHGTPIAQHVQPSHAVVSKNGRFDVYVVPP